MPDIPTVLSNQLIPADILAFDTVEIIQHGQQYDVTEHPVEVGATVVDHVQKRALALAIRGWVTATPLGVPAAQPLETAISWFERNEGQLVQVVTPRGVFRDMVVTSWPWAYDGLNALRFDLSLRHIRLASPVSVPLPARLPAPSVASGAASAVDAGTQAAAPVAAPAAEPAASLLATVLGV